MMNSKLYVYIQLQMRYLIASGSTYMKKLSTGWRDRVRRLATDQVVKGSSPATRHIRYALLINSQNMLNLLSGCYSIYIISKVHNTNIFEDHRHLMHAVHNQYSETL